MEHIQKAHRLKITLAKLPAKSNRFLPSFPSWKGLHPNIYPRLYIRHIAVHAKFCQRQFLAVRVKQAGSGMFPSGTSSLTNAYRLFKSSQARGPESSNAHLELNDIHDAHATDPSVLFFYSSQPRPLQSLRTCLSMAKPRFSAGYL